MKIFIVLILVLAFGNACQNSQVKDSDHSAFEKEYAKIADVTPAPGKFASEDIGASYTDFLKLCGSPDDARSFESSRGETWTLTYEYTKKREKTKCWGTFRFNDDKLESIYRAN